jgi:hypothetical protein
MKTTLLITVTLLFVCKSFGQTRYFTKAGVVSFKAGTALEDIEAINKSTTAIFDAGSGQIEIMLLVKGFEFTRALMQEHFNENYMESDKYPKASFKGKIMDIDKVDFQKEDSYKVTVKGILEIHGIKKEIETTANLKINNKTVLSTATFRIVLSDYNIKIPDLVKEKISKTADITVSCNNAILP